MAPEGFTDTYHHLALLQLGALSLHCYLEPVSVLPRKGQHVQKSFTLSKDMKGRQLPVFLHFTREGKIAHISKENSGADYETILTARQIVQPYGAGQHMMGTNSGTIILRLSL